MFTTLLESRAMRTRRTGGTTLSAVVHGALIAAGVTVGAHQPLNASPEKPHQASVIFVPVERPPLTSHTTTTSTSPVPQPPRPVDLVITPPNITPIGLPAISTEHEVPVDRIAIGGGLGPITGIPASRGVDGGVLEVNEVERAPAVYGQPRPPRYPAMLHATNTNGTVVIRFVIDTLGRAEMGDITVVESTHTLFTESVKSALSDYRFTPGEVGGKRVRTMVQMPFNFTLR
jgi:protein TonB